MHTLMFFRNSVVVLFIVFLSACKSEPGYQALYDKYYEPYEVQLRQNAEVSYPMLDTAYQAYLSEDFETVDRLTTKFLDEYFSVPQVMFAQTIAFVELGKDEAAISNFKTLAMHPFLGARAKWYRGLVHLRRGELADARQLFEELYNRTYEIEKTWAESVLKDLEKMES